MTITGTVRHVDLEGGFWGIEAVNGQKYVPMNALDKVFQIDGLTVQVEARKAMVLGVSQWGEHIEVLSVKQAT